MSLQHLRFAWYRMNEKAPLLKRDLEEDVAQESHSRSEANILSLYRNFVVMCVAFSFNHGCVVSCLAYASAELGSSLGGYGSGTLYICYSLTAFFLSKPVVTMIGPKYGLLAGVSGYCVYIIGFLLALLIPSIAWPVFLVACAIGGVAGGLLWTAQGRYFSRNAKLYSENTDMAVEKVNATFAGVFATSYLGLEMVTKVLATIIFLTAPDAAEYIIFSIYTAIAVLSCFFVMGLQHLDEQGSWDFSLETIRLNSMSAALLVYDDSRLALLLPFQVAFGFASSFVPYYVLGTVIADSDSLGTTYVGLLSAVIVATGASMAIPAAWAANKFGKPLVMTVGGACLALAGFAFFVLSDAQLGTWALIVPYLVVYGIGRGTWENTNKAVVADFFAETPDFSTSAFAAISFSNGFAGSIGYFTFGLMTRLEMAGLVMVSSLLAIGSYLYAAHLHSNQATDIASRLAKYDT